MLCPVPNRRAALATETPKLASAGARDDGIGLLRQAVLECPSALQHEAARFPGNLADNALQADERRRAVASIHHQVFDLAFARNVAGERLGDGRSSQLWQVLTLTIGLLVSGPDSESGVGNVLHGSISTEWLHRT
jgi:hypothetical protein